MDLNLSGLTSPHPTAERLLVVADWSVDPQLIVAAVTRRRDARALAFVVPARLHGLDWVGDPRASCPCARRQVAAVETAAAAAGLELDLARVGDPDPLAAIGDALADWPAQRVLVCERRRLLARPLGFDIASRAQRQTGLPVERLSLEPAAQHAGARRSRWLRYGHCELAQPNAA
jgi:hypothetical protein